MYGLSALSPDLMEGFGDDEMLGGPTDPLSIRLNNPGAIRNSSIKWAGMAPEVDPSGFVRFQTPEDGIRAMSKNLDAYGTKHGLNTVAGIVNRWAPASDGNNVNAYAARVARDMGVSPTDPLDLSDPVTKRSLIEAMATVEAGKKHYTGPQIDSALSGAPGAKPMNSEVMGRLASQEEIGRMAPVVNSPAGRAAMATDMGQEVMSGGAGVSAMQAPPQRAGLSALDPYLKIASQLMPERPSGVWDALLSAGSAMMQSQRPDFLGGLGAGMQAGGQSLAQSREQQRKDTLGRFDLGMKLAQFDQKDGGEYAMSDGVLYNRKTGATQQVGTNKAPQTREVKRGDKVITQEWNGAIWKDIGEAPAHKADKPGETEALIRMAGLDPDSPDGQAYARRILEKKAKGEDGGPFPGSAIDASAYNNMIAYNEKARTGQPTTPQEDMAYSIAYQRASRPTRWTTPDGAMYEAPGIDVSGFVAPKIATAPAGGQGAPADAPPVSPGSTLPKPPGATATAVPGITGQNAGSQPGTRMIVPPDEKPVAGDSAGRFALVPEARDALTQAQKAYFPDGKALDRATAGVAWANVPGTRGAEIYNAVSRAIANRLRIESGAAAPPAEVEAMTKRYLPAPWDSDDLARQKLDGLKQYFDAFATSATKGAGPAIRGENTAPGTPKPQSGSAFPAPAAFSGLGRAEIDAMTPRVSDMTDEQLLAFQARRRQLLGVPSLSGQAGSGGAP